MTTPNFRSIVWPPRNSCSWDSLWGLQYRWIIFGLVEIKMWELRIFGVSYLNADEYFRVVFISVFYKDYLRIPNEGNLNGNAEFSDCRTQTLMPKKALLKAFFFGFIFDFISSLSNIQALRIYLTQKKLSINEISQTNIDQLEFRNAKCNLARELFHRLFSFVFIVFMHNLLVMVVLCSVDPRWLIFRHFECFWIKKKSQNCKWLQTIIALKFQNIVHKLESELDFHSCYGSFVLWCLYYWWIIPLADNI